MVKSIFKRIVVGVGVALGIMFLKGSLIGNVYAQASSVGTAGSVYASCVDCYQLDVNLGNSWNGWKKGTLQFNGAIYRYTDSYDNVERFTQIIANVYIVANNVAYSCKYNVDNNQASYFNDGAGVLNQFQTTGFSVTCPNVEPGGLGIMAIHIQGLGYSANNFGMRLYAPITFTTNDDFNSVTSAIEDNTDAQNETTDAINETNDTLKDDSVDNEKAEDDISDMQDKVASNGTITQLITLPIQLYQKLLNLINGSCVRYYLGSLFNHELWMPCIDLEGLLGRTVYNAIDMILCGLFVLSFRKKMVDIFNHMTSLNDRGNELE